jgi:hypothetical protein
MIYKTLTIAKQIIFVILSGAKNLIVDRSFVPQDDKLIIEIA